MLLKKVGEKVRAGEAIAIVGSSGELSTGATFTFRIVAQWKRNKS